VWFIESLHYRKIYFQKKCKRVTNLGEQLIYCSFCVYAYKYSRLLYYVFAFKFCLVTLANVYFLDLLKMNVDTDIDTRRTKGCNHASDYSKMALQGGHKG